jgi:hypothetical protein
MEAKFGKNEVERSHPILRRTLLSCLILAIVLHGLIHLHRGYQLFRF